MIRTIARTYNPIDNYALKTGLYRGVIEISSSVNLLLQLATSQGLKPTKRTPFWPNRSTYQKKKKKRKKEKGNNNIKKNNKNSNNDNNDNNTNNNIRNNNNINSNDNNKIIILIIIMMKITTITKIIIM